MLLLSVPHSGSTFALHMTVAITGKVPSTGLSPVPEPLTRRTLYTAHYNESLHDDVRTVIDLGLLPRATLRDPILSLFTNQLRNWSLESDEQLLRDLLALYELDPFFLPIDGPTIDRVSFLRQWLDEKWLNEDELSWWANTWPIVNESSTTLERDAYKFGNLEGAKEGLRSWNVFQHYRSALAPVFMENGFDLPWL